MKTALFGFGIELAYALDAKAKRMNQAANEEYACALGNGRTFDGNCGSIEEDTAWSECQRSARLVDECDDIIAELEDMEGREP